MKLIDLTMPLREYPFDHEPRIKRVTHRQGANLLGLSTLLHQKGLGKKVLKVLKYLLGIERITAKSFLDHQGLAIELFKGDTHTGTHLDAPYHYGSKTAGLQAKTIDQIPLEWCIGNGVLLDVRKNNSKAPITQAELEAAADRIGYRIQPLDIVLIHTGAITKFGESSYRSAHRGVSEEAILWLVNKGVKIIGIDAFSFDRPFEAMEKDYMRTRDSRFLWPAHLIGRKVEYCHIENIVNMDQLPVPIGFRLYCFPIPIENGSAGWVRLVAEVTEKES